MISCFEGSTVLHCSQTGTVVSNPVQRTDDRSTLSVSCTFDIESAACQNQDSSLTN